MGEFLRLGGYFDLAGVYCIEWRFADEQIYPLSACDRLRLVECGGHEEGREKVKGAVVVWEDASMEATEVAN